MTPMDNQDSEHLKLLAIFHYIFGGIGAIFSCFPIIHLVIGIALLTEGIPADSGSGEMPRAFGWLFVVMPTCFILLGWCVSACILFAGRRLQLRANYTFCFVIACLECLFMPFGTVLGVFTIIVLARPSVKDLFESDKALQADREWPD